MKFDFYELTRIEGSLIGELYDNMKMIENINISRNQVDASCGELLTKYENDNNQIHKILHKINKLKDEIIKDDITHEEKQ